MRAKPHRHSTTQTALPAHQHSRLHQSLPDVVKSTAPPSCHKHAEPIKRVACPDRKTCFVPFQSLFWWVFMTVRVII